MLEYGTPLVAGRDARQGRPVRARRPGAGLRHRRRGRPRDRREHRRASSCRPPGAPDAVLESVAAGITTIFCITEGIPALDMIPVVEEVRLAGVRLIGPNCPGATSPGPREGRDHPGLDPPRGPRRRRVALGHAHLRGRPGDDRRGHRPVDVRRASAATRSSGRRSSTILQLFAEDPETDALVLIGEIGGAAEEEAAAWAAEHLRGRAEGRRSSPGAPRPRASGWATPARSSRAAAARRRPRSTALEAAGFRVADSPTELPALLRAAGYRG